MKVGDRVKVVAAFDSEDKPRPDWKWQLGKIGAITEITPGSHFNVSIKVADGTLHWFHFSELRLLNPQLFIQFGAEHI
jgi:hypothetical protein